MKRIIKSSSPEFFNKWKLKLISTHNRIPTYDDFFGHVKHQLKKDILIEQGYICCYCMGHVDSNSHIEHFKPQSSSVNEDLNYNNMFISCNGYKGDRSHCGHRKNDWYDEKLTVSPLEENVELLFQYLSDGTIQSSNNRAVHTMSNLNLNSFALQRARKAAIYASGIFDEEELTNESIDGLVEFFSNKDDKGCYQPFCQAILYCLIHNT